MGPACEPVQVEGGLAQPMVPVAPCTVMGMMPPSSAGLGPAKMTVTWLGLAWIRVLSIIRDSLAVPSEVAPLSEGLRSYRVTVKPWPVWVLPVNDEHT